MAEFKLDSDIMQAVVTKAIFETMTPEKREDLVMAAIRGLLDVPKKTQPYGPEPKSQLQESFEYAAQFVARDVVRTRMADDAAFRSKIDAVFAAAVEKAFSGDNREKLIDQIAEQIVNGLKLDRY